MTILAGSKMCNGQRQLLVVAIEGMEYATANGCDQVPPGHAVVRMFLPDEENMLGCGQIVTLHILDELNYRTVRFEGAV